MPQFTYTGSDERIFPDLSASDGSTLIVKPGDVVTLNSDPNSSDLVAASAAPAPAPEAPQTPSEAPTTDATPSA